jgi:hypothetical protein
MRLNLVRLSMLAGLVTVGLASLCSAAPITAPPGLTVGQQYRLVFVTADLYTATNTNISYYNGVVTTEADAVAALNALSTTWYDIGSTATVNAIDNIGADVGVPIYDTDGHLVAADASTTSAHALFSNQSLDGNMTYNENGSPIAGFVEVWTGTYVNGTPGGHPALGSTGTVTAGATNTTSGFWIANQTLAPTTARPLYAISGIITYGEAPVPEPGTMSLMMLGGMFLVGKVRSMRGRAVSGKRP